MARYVLDIDIDPYGAILDTQTGEIAGYINHPSDAPKAQTLMDLANAATAHEQALREALEAISILDYTCAATNGCAYRAVTIARTALEVR